MRTRARRGATAIEFAFLFPVLLAFLAGTLELGWMYQRWFAVSIAAMDGARAASMETDAATATTAADAAVRSSLAAYNVVPSRVTTTILAGDPEIVQVEVQLLHQSLTGLIPAPWLLSRRAAAPTEDLGT